MYVFWGVACLCVLTDVCLRACVLVCVYIHVDCTRVHIGSYDSS